MARNTPKAAPEAAAKTGDAQDARPAPAMIVTCLIAAGRRRANRRWASGPTEVADGELSEAELAEIEADPMFSVRPVVAEG